MVINAASITCAKLAATKPWVTRTMHLPPTQWVAATPTRVGTLAPDGVRWQIKFIAMILIFVKTIIITL
jgi:hypothetical protein